MARLQMPLPLFTLPYQILHNFLPRFDFLMTFLCRQSFQVIHHNICHFSCGFSI